MASNLVPFAKLYETCADFVVSHDSWVNGDMSKVNPDNVEEAVGGAWRGLYKLEKEFADNPIAKNIAAKTKVKVEEFREQLPIVSAICNPGLRDRHWVRLAEIVGIDNFAPDEGCSVSRNSFKLFLTRMQQAASISIQALLFNDLQAF